MGVIMITSGMPDMGIGFEAPAADIMLRPPHPMEVGVFAWEVMIDMLVYGLWMAALCLSAFSLVLFGFGDGNLGSGCNDSYSEQCDTVFRARATTFVCLTWFALFLAWEMVNMRRSFFRMQPKSTKYFTQWAIDVWRNKFLFWAVIAGFVTIFPTLYIPVINHKVFKHTGISWEWVSCSSKLFSSLQASRPGSGLSESISADRSAREVASTMIWRRKLLPLTLMKNLIDMSCLLAW